MVTGVPLQQDQLDLGHRILVPYLAKPVYRLIRGHLHSWNPAFFALLIVNSAFVASTAWLIVVIGQILTQDLTVSLIAAFLYLTNFIIANSHLAGYVDSSVDFALILITVCLLFGRWWTLPFLGVLGALAKETFVPLSFVFALTWFLSERKLRPIKTSQLAWIGLMAFMGSITVAFVMSHQSPPYSLSDFAASRKAAASAGASFLPGLMRCLTSHEFVFAFGWLLPLGLPRLRRLPKTWVNAAVCTGLVALLLGAYDDALGNAVRPLFGSLGPLLSLSGALFLARSEPPTVRTGSSQLG